MLNPYDLYPSEPAGSAFEFTTESGHQYFLYFRDLSDRLFGYPVFDFGFVPLNDDRSDKPTKDKRIAHTVCQFIDDFLATRDCIVLFYPMSDSRRSGNSRNRLFERWFDLYNPFFKCQNLSREQIVLEYSDGTRTISTVVTVYCKEPEVPIAQELVLADPVHLINVIL